MDGQDKNVLSNKQTLHFLPRLQRPGIAFPVPRVGVFIQECKAMFTGTLVSVRHFPTALWSLCRSHHPPEKTALMLIPHLARLDLVGGACASSSSPRITASPSTQPPCANCSSSRLQGVRRGRRQIQGAFHPTSVSTTPSNLPSMQAAVICCFPPTQADCSPFLSCTAVKP